MIITVKILKKGRKYWAAATDPKGWACKVIINEVSKDLKPGQIVSLDAEDIGTKTRWGSTYIYEPSAIATDEYIAHQSKLKLAALFSATFCFRAIRRALTAAAEEKLGKRVLVNADDCPATGKPWRMHNRPNGKIIVIESYGKKWYLHSEDACCYDGMLPDDQWVRYAYYRDATPAEIAAVEAAEEGY